MAVCNVTLTEERIIEDPLYKSVTFHHVGLIVSAVFGLIAVVIATWLMFLHATHYSRPDEQRNIIRILFMIPVYAVVSFLSYLYYRHAIYFEVIRDCYEAFAIASFFTLLCHYLAPGLHEQKNYFRSISPKNWLLPLNWFQKCTGGQSKGPFRVPRSGLTWFNVIWVCVFQYCFIRVLFTIVSVLAQATGRYCESSLSPAFAHVWVMVFEGVSVTFAMYGLIQFYYQVKQDIASHSPLMKILCIKLVIFFSFWQTLVISFLVSSGAIEPNRTIDYPDIKVGIPSMLLCIEMAIFAVLHIWAFSWREYDISKKLESFDEPGRPMPSKTYLGGKLGSKAFLDAFNPWDLVKATGRSFRWLFIGSRRRHEDVSYQKGTTLGDLNNTVPPQSGIRLARNGEYTHGTYMSPAFPQTSYRGDDGMAYTLPREDDKISLLASAQARQANVQSDTRLPSATADGLVYPHDMYTQVETMAQPKASSTNYSRESESGYTR